MSIDDFKWLLAYGETEGLMLMCSPKSTDGRKYPFELAAWAGGLQGFTGEIAILEDDETISFSGSDLFALLDKMQKKTIKLQEG